VPLQVGYDDAPPKPPAPAPRQLDPSAFDTAPRVPVAFSHAPSADDLLADLGDPTALLESRSAGSPVPERIEINGHGAHRGEETVPAPPPTPPSSLFTNIRRDLGYLQSGRPPASIAPPEPPAVTQSVAARSAVSQSASGEPDETSPASADMSLRRRVHRALDANVLPGDQRDDTELLALVFDELGLTDLERLSAQSYVRSWLLETRTGERIRTA
jgi:hypothetical protein